MIKEIKGKIRKIKYSDLVRCQDIIYADLNIACESYKENVELRKHYSFSNLEKFLNNSKIFYVFESNNTVLGVGRINSKNEIRTIYIDPHFHKKGIGKKLIFEIEKYLKKLGINKAYLHAIASAIPFYKKQGYVMVGKDNKMEKKLNF